VFNTEGEPVTGQPQMTCDDCTKYIYKDSEGKCYDFIHDPDYNADNYCFEEEGTECKDMCTASFTPRTCPF
jgi:hypothetical protein